MPGSNNGTGFRPPGGGGGGPGAPGLNGSHGFGFDGADGEEGLPGPQGPRGQQAITVNRVNVGNVGGTKLVDVVAPNGTLASVYSCGGLFEMVTSPTAELIALAALGGLDAVASVGVPGAIWVRLPNSEATARFTANPPVAIDAGAGDDDNDGTLAFPLRTAEEFSRRMNGATWTGTVTISLVGTVGQFSGRWKSKAGRPQFFGPAPARSAAGTMATILTDAAGSGQEAGFTSVAGPALVDKARLRILTSGTPSHVGAIAYVKGFQGGDVTKPFTTTWMAPTSLTNDVAGTEIVPTAGDTFCIETLGATITGLNITWEALSGVTVGFPYVQDCSFQIASVLGQWFFKTTDKPSENDGHLLLQNCTFASGAVHDDFTNCDIQLRHCDCQNSTIWSQDGTLYAWDASIFRGRVITDNCAIEMFNSNCIDQAGGIGMSVGPGGQILGLNSFLCISRSTGQGILNLFGGLMSLTGCIFWAPAYSGAANSRNGLTDGYFGRAGSYCEVTSVAALNFMRSSTGTPTVLADVAQNIPCIDEAHQCCVVFTTGVDGGQTFHRDTSSTYVPVSNGTLGSRTFGQAGGFHGRAAGGGISTMVPGGTAPAFGHGAWAGVRKTSAVVAVVGAVLTNVVGIDVSAPGFSGAMANGGFRIKGTLVGDDGAGNWVSTTAEATFRVVAGVLTLRGAAAVTAPIGDAALVGIAANFAAVGTTAMLQVTGVVATTITFNGTVEAWSRDFVG